VSLVGVSNEVSTSALKSKEDTDDEQEENDALDDSVEILCFSFSPLFKLDSCNELTMLHKPSFMYIFLHFFSMRLDSYKCMNQRNERIKYLSKNSGAKQGSYSCHLLLMLYAIRISFEAAIMKLQITYGKKKH
jgi:hypothetical protein